MNIDNKTKAAVLREYTDRLIPGGEAMFVRYLIDEANRLDPPRKPIHPHEGCMGMIVSHLETGRIKAYTGILHADSDNYIIPREARSTVPAFLCDGTRPEWVKADDFVWFIERGEANGPMSIDWHLRNYEFFCVLNPVEVR